MYSSEWYRKLDKPPSSRRTLKPLKLRSRSSLRSRSASTGSRSRSSRLFAKSGRLSISINSPVDFMIAVVQQVCVLLVIYIFMNAGFLNNCHIDFSLVVFFTLFFLSFLCFKFFLLPFSDLIYSSCSLTPQKLFCVLCLVLPVLRKAVTVIYVLIIIGNL